MSSGTARPLPLAPAGLPTDLSMRLIKAPRQSPAPARDPAIAPRVSEMLLRIEREGLDAVRAYSRELDGWEPEHFEVSQAQVVAAGESFSAEPRAAIGS